MTTAPVGRVPVIRSTTTPPTTRVSTAITRPSDFQRRTRRGYQGIAPFAAPGYGRGFGDPMNLQDTLVRDILPRVQKPSRYLGNELNAVLDKPHAPGQELVRLALV